MIRHSTIAAILLIGLLGSQASVVRAEPSETHRDAAAPPRPEHPRPQFRREAWRNLNGTWQFRFDPEDRGLSEQWPRDDTTWPRRIVVPFCWQSELSGIADTSGQTIGWYRREVTVPDAWQGQRVWLCFGAVDHEARVWVDGEAVGRHEGGYTPFAFDITKHATPGKTVRLDVRVFDATSGDVPLGLQGPPWFTPASGIWQTVWLEGRPPRHIERLRLVGEHPVGNSRRAAADDSRRAAADDSRRAAADDSRRAAAGEWCVTVELDAAGPDGSVEVAIDSESPGVQSERSQVRLADGRATHRTMLAIDKPRIWSPDDPHLYPIRFRLTDAQGRSDTVHSYFALRTIERGEHGDLPYEAILLNGRPVFLCGVLDPGYYPEGVYTAADDARLRDDIAAAKRLGFNLLRPHVKAVDPRKLYWADRLGMLVWPEMPCTRSTTAASREAWEATMRAIIARDRNHPSIIGWTLFHDGWGLGGEQLKTDKKMQAWVARMWQLVRHELDPTRLVEDNVTANADHVVSDLNSWQFCIDDFWIARQHIDRFVSTVRPGSPANYVPGLKQGTAPVFCSQFSALGPSGGDRDVSWSFRYLVTQLRRHGAIQGFCYASLYDVEWRRDGLLQYDRRAKEFGYDAFANDMTPADLMRPDFIGCDAPPLIEASPGDQVSLPLLISHYSDAPGPPIVRWHVAGIDSFGRAVATSPRQRNAVWQANRPMYQPPLRVKLPEGSPMVGSVQLELLDRHENRLAVNYVNLVVGRSLDVDPSLDHDPLTADSIRVEVLGPRLVAVRFAPREFAQFKTDQLGWDWLDTRGKFYAYGNCELEYHIALPEFIRDAIPTKMVFMAEMATRDDQRREGSPLSRRERVRMMASSGPSPPAPLPVGEGSVAVARRVSDCPQTGGDRHAGTVEVQLLDRTLWQLPLPDDPADSRGVLSHQRRFHHGSYGYLVRKVLDLTDDMELRSEIRQREFFPLIFRTGSEQMGLSLYGHRLGRYTIDPTLIIQTAQKLPERIGWISVQPVTIDRLLDRARVVEGIRNSDDGGHEWRFTTEPPPANWQEPGFDDSQWRRKQFKVPSQRGPVAIPSPEMWMRTELKIIGRPLGMVFRYSHDEDVTVFLNGRRLIDSRGHMLDTIERSLRRDELELLQRGDNTVAVHTRQTRGGPGVDLEVQWIEVIEKQDNGAWPVPRDY